MILRETSDIGDIKAILCDPAIYDTITDDNSGLASEFEPPLEGHRYIGGYINDKIMAVMVYHSHEDQNLCHVQVLKSHRAEHARKFGKMALNFKDEGPLFAEIPECYENVLLFADLFGFKPIGRKVKTYLKGGVAHDDIILRLEE